MSGPVCPVCGAAWGTCGGHPTARVWVLDVLSRHEAEVRHWATVVEVGLALIVVGVLTLIM